MAAVLQEIGGVESQDPGLHEPQAAKTQTLNQKKTFFSRE